MTHVIHNEVNMPKCYEKHKELTDQEKFFYNQVGAFQMQHGISDFDFSCQNRKELALRVREVAMNNGFPVRLGV